MCIRDRWYDGRDVPEEYRVTPQPPQPERPDPSKVEMDAAAPGQRTAQTAEQPVSYTHLDVYKRQSPPLAEQILLLFQ